MPASFTLHGVLSGDAFDDAARGGEAEGACDEARSAVAALAVESEGGAGFALRADGAVRARVEQPFAGIDAVDPKGFFAARKTVFAAQRGTDLGQQAIMRGMGEVGNVERGGIAPSPRPTDDEHRNGSIPTGGDEKTLLGEAVDGIEHVVEAGLKNLVRVRFDKEGVQRANSAIGVDGSRAPRHRFGLGLANRTIERMDLAVHVAHANIVEVNERERAHAGAGQSFDGPRTHAADTHNADVRSLEPFQSLGSEQAADAAEARVVFAHGSPRVVKSCEGRAAKACCPFQSGSATIFARFSVYSAPVILPSIICLSRASRRWRLVWGVAGMLLVAAVALVSAAFSRASFCLSISSRRASTSEIFCCRVASTGVGVAFVFSRARIGVGAVGAALGGSDAARLVAAGLAVTGALVAGSERITLSGFFCCSAISRRKYSISGESVDLCGEACAAAETVLSAKQPVTKRKVIRFMWLT